MTTPTNAVRDNTALSRFELDIEGTVAFANYRRTATTDIITHTETPRDPRRVQGDSRRLLIAQLGGQPVGDKVGQSLELGRR